MQVQKHFIEARRAGHEGRYQECMELMKAVHELEPWNTRILADLAEVCTDLHNYELAVSGPSFPTASSLLSIHMHSTRSATV